MSGTLQHHEWPLLNGYPPIPMTDVFKSDGQLAARLEHHIDADPDCATALPVWKVRMQSIANDMQHYNTLVVDSLSFLQDLAVNWHRLNDPPTYAGNSDPRKWYANAKDDVEKEMLRRLPWMRTKNILIIAHPSEKTSEFSDTVVRSFDAIGKMGHRLGTGFAEVYRAKVMNVLDPTTNTPTGESRHVLQTQSDNEWGAMSLIQAPNHCDLEYQRLWDGGTTPRPVQAVCYGQFASGKSTFAATWPQPMLVIATDPLRKTRPL